MKCFLCSKDIAELPEGDPRRQSDCVYYSSAFVIEVLPGAGDFNAPGPDRATVLCWSCFHIVQPDCWMSEEGWNAGKPAVLFVDLPLYDHDSEVAEEPETYAHVAVLSR